MGMEEKKFQIKAIYNRDGDILDSTAGSIRGRLLRVCEVVDNEIEQYPPSQYTENVRNATLMLKENGRVLDFNGKYEE